VKRACLPIAPNLETLGAQDAHEPIHFELHFMPIAKACSTNQSQAGISKAAIGSDPLTDNMDTYKISSARFCKSRPFRTFFGFPDHACDLYSLAKALMSATSPLQETTHTFTFTYDRPLKCTATKFYHTATPEHDGITLLFVTGVGLGKFESLSSSAHLCKAYH
jgi:hypothetical protein